MTTKLQFSKSVFLKEPTLHQLNGYILLKEIKKKKKDNIEKYKTRLVAKGFTQIKGIDYNLTYSPTLSLDSLKLIFSHDF